MRRRLLISKPQNTFSKISKRRLRPPTSPPMLHPSFINRHSSTRFLCARSRSFFHDDPLHKTYLHFFSRNTSNKRADFVYPVLSPRSAKERGN